MNSKFSKFLVPLLLLITIAAISVAVWAVWFRESGVVLSPDYAPQDKEPNAEKIPGDTNTKLEVEEGGGAIGLEYVNNVKIDLSDKTVALQFANPGKSTQDMVLQIVIRDVIIVQSGRIEPGNQVRSLSLLEGAEKKLTEGIYDGKFVILSYDPTSGEKAMVNTEAVITIMVQK